MELADMTARRLKPAPSPSALHTNYGAFSLWRHLHVAAKSCAAPPSPRTRRRCTTSGSQPAGDSPQTRAPAPKTTSPSPPSSPGRSSSPAAYQALVSELAPLSPHQLREAAHQRPSQLMDSGFLFWLRDQERRPGLGAAQRELLSRLGQELTMMREWTEESSNRTLLPSLASSLAYSNLQRWREETGGAAPEVVPGVDLEQLYRLGEKEERKLRRSLEGGGGGGGTGPRREVSRSGIEEFTKHNKAYADLAAGTMARVRQRLMGFDDDGPSAAAGVLRALLHQMGSAEERANCLPEAFTPPGLQIAPEPASAAAAGGASAGGSGGGGSGGKPTFLVTNPSALMAAARERLAALTAQKNGADGGGSSSRAVDAAGAGGAAAGEAAAAAAGPVRQEPPLPPLLPSGEDEAAALEELLEMVDEYDRAVFSRKTPLERMGHNRGPW